MTGQRTAWIDLLRGFCMIAILWFHTEFYFVGHAIVPYAFYVGDVLATFFFLSGYLFYSEKPFDFRYKLKRIGQGLVIPYFIFTSLIALPKAIVHHKTDQLQEAFIAILNGSASWFVAALIVAQLLLSVTLYLTRNRGIVAFLAVTMLILAHFVGNSCEPSPLFNPYNLWHVNEALLAYALMAMGYLYHSVETLPAFSKNAQGVSVKRFGCLGAMLLLCLLSKIAIYCLEPQMIVGPIIVSNYPLFVFDLLVSVSFLVFLFQALPANRMVQWTGSHSLVYYFICGGVPLLTGRLFQWMGYEYQHLLSVVPVFLVVYVVASAIVWLVYRYLPFAVGKR